jgi:hypothetical protein
MKLRRHSALSSSECAVKEVLQRAKARSLLQVQILAGAAVCSGDAARERALAHLSRPQHRDDAVALE